MIIDGHSHACGKFLTADSILQTLNSNGVDQVVLVPGELNSTAEYALPNIAAVFPKLNVVRLTNYLTRFVMNITRKVKDIPAGNEYVHKLKTILGDRIIQFVWITTAIGDIEEYLDDRLIAWQFKGSKLHQCWEHFSVNSDFFSRVASWAEDHGIPLFIHLYSNREVTKLIEYKKKHPKLKLIVAHLFGLEQFIQDNFKDDHLYFDISTLQLISSYRLMKAIEFVGAGHGHVLFATDTPYGGKDNIAGNINRIATLDIPDESKKMILGLNMEKLLT